uniref:Pectate lyase n=1 Tax=viral metagenome TaxID=1070528 RepID=A0A6M3XW89_9ZZZZ
MPNQNVGYGRALLDAVATQVPAFGRVFVVFNSLDTKEAYDSMSNVMKTDTDGKVRFFTSLSTAVDAADTNNNDVICLDGQTSHKVSSMLAVSKNRVHFIGFDGGGKRVENQRTLISNTGAGAEADTAMVKVTGTGVTFRNIAFKNNWTVAQNLYCVDDQSSNGYFENCTIHNLGSAHLTNANCAVLRLSSQDTTYVNCQIGADTLKSTVASGQVVLIKKQTTAATRVKLIDCYFRAYTDKTTHVFIRVAANGDIDRSVTLIRPVFDNFNWDASNGGALMAVAVASASGLVSGGINLFDVMLNGKGTTDVASSAVGNAGVWITGNSPTAGTAGISVQAIA